ncbi:uncharacterized protein METZ01_LOCUS131648 [marine metagenome]|uniref:Uncharacterized protein n=1 Tax=marine metagenome TaxID=408172 RepID=A0A381YPC3_9ZZZZ
MIDRTLHSYLSNFTSLSNMRDPLQERIEKLKIMRESAKRRSGLYSDIMKLDDKSTTRSLRALTKAPAPGKKIQKIGFIMLWIPEPTGITCAVGGPMILAGRYLEKVYNGAKISDVSNHTKDSFSTIHDFKNSVL